MKIIYKVTICLFIVIFQSCSISLIKQNVPSKNIDYFLGKVANESQVREKYGTPLSVHYKTIEGLEYKILVYPSDSSSGNQFYCNHATYSFKQNGIGNYYLATIVNGIPQVLVSEYTGVAQSRCNRYASEQTNINNIWSGVAAGLNSGSQNYSSPTNQYNDNNDNPSPSNSNISNHSPEQKMTIPPKKNPGYSCGFKPFAKMGCNIGDCVNGEWQQICNKAIGSNSCGAKPFAKMGCVIGDCVSGEWQQICNKAIGSNSCGFKPFAKMGCRIGNCVNGEWQQVCN